MSSEPTPEGSLADSPSDSPQIAQVTASAEEQFRLLMESVEDYAIFFTDSLGRIANWNAGAQRILGYTTEEILGQPMEILFAPEDRLQGDPMREMRRAATEGRAQNDRWHLRKDGTRFWGSGILTALRGDGGALLGFCKIMRDLTSHKRWEEELLSAHDAQGHVIEMLQRSLLLTPALNAFPNLTLATHYEAAFSEAEMGGDFFDAFSFWDNRVALVVGDISGKGLGAALYTAQVKYALRAFLHEHGGEPGAALANLNAFLLSLRDGPYGNTAIEMREIIASRRRAETVSSPALVSLAVMVVNTTTGESSCALAGAETPLILRAGLLPKHRRYDYTRCKVDEAVALGSGGPLLGVAPDAVYRASRCSLRNGDLILLTTDGITEARRPSGNRPNGMPNIPRTEFFGLERAAEAVRSYALTSGDSGLAHLESACNVVVEEARAFAQGIINDDVCLLLARYA